MIDKIRLFLDEDVHTNIAPIMRDKGFDVISTQEVMRRGESDLSQLNF